MQHKKTRIFLHAGSHKTGTTSIQWALSAGRARLRERGICYPETACPPWAEFGHHMLPWSVVTRPNYLPTRELRKRGFDGESRAAIWEGVRAEISASGAHTAVLSSEEFDILSTEEIASVGSELAAYDVTPVLFLRNATDLIESAYRTFVVHGGSAKPIERFVSSQRIRLDYFRLVSDWSQVAHEGRVIVCAYDDPIIRANVVGAFCDIIGLLLEDLALDGAPRQNESLPAFICELLRFFRRNQFDEDSVKRWLDDIREVRFSPSANRAYSVLGPDLREELDRRYAREVERLLGSPELRDGILGDLTLRRSSMQPKVISNTGLAILALRRELGTR